MRIGIIEEWTVSSRNTTGEIYKNQKYIPYRVKVSWNYQLMLKGEYTEKKEFVSKDLSIR